MKFKAIFQILIIIFANILIADNVAAANICCEKTTDGNYCQSTSPSNCDPSSHTASTSCNLASFCQPGCCYNSDEGRCYKNTIKSQCESREGSTWSSDPSCSINQCKLGCCNIGDQCSFVTKTRCKKESTLYNINMTFDESITTELDCINKCRNIDQGCCVKADGTCTFTTRAACTETSSPDPQIGFHKNMLCSNDALPCACAKQHHIGCLSNKDEVYWFDSCNNPENIYNSNREASYNGGYVLSKEQSCNPNFPNIKSSNCGNCNFYLGSLCGEAPKGLNIDYSCLSLDCEKVTKDLNSPSVNQDNELYKKNGESWCIYDSDVGNGRDAVGSRHYRHICINNKEIIEECKDYREEICVQGVLGQPPATAAQQFSFAGDYVEAGCRTNRWESCLDCNNLEKIYPCGSECNRYNNEDERKVCCAKKCCENIYTKDCFWTKSGLSEIKGMCIPTVPPGFTFWAGENSTTTSKNSKELCDKADLECQVTFKTGGGARFFGAIGKALGSAKKECVNNCQCLDKDFVIAANDFCKSLGDCGAYKNYIGIITRDGFVTDYTKLSKQEYYLTNSDIIHWTTFKESPTKFEKPSFWDELSTGTTLSLATIIGSGIYTGVQSWEVGKFLTGAFTGLRILATPIAALGEPTWGSWFRGAASAFGTKSISVTSAQLVDKGIVAQEFLNIRGYEGVIYDASEKAWFYTIKGNPIAKVSADKTASLTSTFGTTTTQPTAFATVWSAINTLAWIYMIYNLIDVFGTKYDNYKIKIDCEPWVAPEGGNDCEKCNNENKPCSEYRCKSLGQTCSLINVGTEKEKCVNIHPNDVTSPIISPWSEVISHPYTETLQEGFKGYTFNQKVPPFQRITLGIKTNEPSQCKYGFDHSQKYEEMPDFYFGTSIYDYNHSISFSMPSELLDPQVLRATNNGIFTLYIRCKDGAGNANDRPYYIKFQIDKSPDLTPPVIEMTSILTNSYITHDATETDLSIYLNEPSSCKWDPTDIKYESMTHSFTCYNSGFAVTSIYYGLYECKTRLTNLHAGDNTFYFRCKDNSNNVNADSSVFKLIGTVPLLLTSLSPKGELVNITNITLEATTSNGAQNGISFCFYSPQTTGITNMVAFLNTNSTHHSQPLTLATGSYNYNIACMDIAGNIASNSTSFALTLDTTPPRLLHVYTESNLLNILLSEDTICEYSQSPFSFGSGTRMTGDQRLHKANLGNTIYHIICQDYFENEISVTIYP